MTPQATFDVCVVGGGPAGTTIARQLARLHHSVCLIDKGGVAAGHIGVSLPPSIWPILEQLELRSIIESAPFLLSPATIVRWGNAEGPLYNRHPDPGMTVQRQEFDALLADAAAAQGATVIKPAVASRPKLLSDGSWHVSIQKKSGKSAVHARYLVDAAGKAAVLRHPKQSRLPRTFAVYGYWQGVPIRGCEARVQAGETFWAWGTPLPNDEFLSAVFVDESEVATHGRQGLHRLFLGHLTRSELLRPCLQGTLTRIGACDASSVMTRSESGPGYIKVGEAALCVDPLSSQGVQRAMVSALQAAAVVNTVLRSPGHAQLAHRFYRDRLHEFAQSDLDASAAYYDQQARICPTDFWLERASHAASKSAVSSDHLQPPPAGQHLCLSREARLEITGALQNDLIVPHRALHHPRLVRPVAYLAGHPIESLLAPAQRELTPAELRAAWGSFVSEAEADFVVSWLFSHEILIPAASLVSAGDHVFAAEALSATWRR